MSNAFSNEKNRRLNTVPKWEDSFKKGDVVFRWETPKTVLEVSGSSIVVQSVSGSAMPEKIQKNSSDCYNFFTRPASYL